MTIYGTFDSDTKELLVKSDGVWSDGKWHVFAKQVKNKTEARKLFYEDYVKKGHITSQAVFN